MPASVRGTLRVVGDGLRFRSRPGRLRPRKLAASAQQLIVGVDHQPDQLLKAGSRPPAELSLRLGRVADQMIDLRRALERLVDPDVIVDRDAGLVEGDLQALPHRVRLSGGDDVVVRESCWSISHIAST